MKAFILPDLGEGLHEAELLEWHVAEGDQVEVDQVLVSVETAKAIVDVPSPWAGKITRLGAAVGDVVKVGQTLVEIASGESDEAVIPASVSVVGELRSASTQQVATEKFSIGAAVANVPVRQNAAPPLQSGPVIRPAVLAFAQRMGVADQVLHQSGELAEALDHAAVVGLYQAQRSRVDVPSAPELTDIDQNGQLKGARRQMALASTKSTAEVAAVTLFDEMIFYPDSSPADLTVACIRALASACQEFPLFNAWFDGATMTLDRRPTVDIGLAVDSEEGLFVPVLRAVEHMSAEQCRSEMNRLVSLCHERRIAPRDMQGATISLSNFGMLAGQFATPMIVPPQVAILGVGRVQKRPVVVSERGHDQIVIGKVLPLSLSFDHRVATGGEAARFLVAIKQALIHRSGTE